MGLGGGGGGGHEPLGSPRLSTKGEFVAEPGKSSFKICWSSDLDNSNNNNNTNINFIYKNNKNDNNINYNHDSNDYNYDKNNYNYNNNKKIIIIIIINLPMKHPGTREREVGFFSLIPVPIFLKELIPVH